MTTWYAQSDGNWSEIAWNDDPDGQGESGTPAGNDTAHSNGHVVTIDGDLPDPITLDSPENATSDGFWVGADAQLTGDATIAPAGSLHVYNGGTAALSVAAGKTLHVYGIVQCNEGGTLNAANLVAYGGSSLTIAAYSEGEAWIVIFGNFYLAEGATLAIVSLPNVSGLRIAETGSLVAAAGATFEVQSGPGTRLQNDGAITLADGANVSWFGVLVRPIAAAEGWTEQERAQIRHRLGLDGDAIEPAASPQLGTLSADVADKTGFKLAADGLDRRFDGLARRRGFELPRDDGPALAAVLPQGGPGPRRADPRDLRRRRRDGRDGPAHQ